MFFNISNHASSSWSKKQLEEAQRLGGMVQDVPFPSVDPQATKEDVERLAWDIVKAIRKENAIACAMVQGEMSLTFHIVSILQSYNIPCYVACSERKSIETVLEDGTTRKTSVFEFVQFREY